jgi:hypothetical protein
MECLDNTEIAFMTLEKEHKRVMFPDRCKKCRVC